MSREINTFSDDAIRKIARETFKQMRAADGNRGFYQQRTPLPWNNKVKIGKAGSSITKGSTGNVTIWNGASGSESSTGETINCRALFAAVAANKWCVMENINGNWYVSQVEC